MRCVSSDGQRASSSTVVNSALYPLWTARMQTRELTRMSASETSATCIWPRKAVCITWPSVLVVLSSLAAAHVTDRITRPGLVCAFLLAPLRARCRCTLSFSFRAQLSTRTVKWRNNSRKVGTACLTLRFGQPHAPVCARRGFGV